VPEIIAEIGALLAALAAVGAMIVGIVALRRKREETRREEAEPARAAEKPPAPAPPVGNIPHRRNRFFTGRDELLEELRSSLASGRTAALTQAVVGLGGVGKTQLAVEYAYLHQEHYENVLWVQSDDEATLAVEYTKLAGLLGLPESNDPGGAARLWLETHDRWLLIFDNAENEKILDEYLPRGQRAHIIITSRHPDWRTAVPLQVPTWERGKSVDFLLERTGQDDKESAGALARTLGDLPLALEQAAIVPSAGETEASVAGEHLARDNRPACRSRAADRSGSDGHPSGGVKPIGSPTHLVGVSAKDVRSFPHAFLNSDLPQASRSLILVGELSNSR